jgi:hypothetical protein
MPRHQSDRRSTVAAVLPSSLAALVAAAVLRTQGIVAVVESPAVGAAPPAPGSPEEGIGLLVAPEDEERAVQILRDRQMI